MFYIFLHHGGDQQGDRPIVRAHLPAAEWDCGWVNSTTEAIGECATRGVYIATAYSRIGFAAARLHLEELGYVFVPCVTCPLPPEGR